MSPDADLDRLAELAGIEPVYWDIWGNRHDVSLAAKQGILAALGISATTPAEIAASLQRLDEAPWRRTLPPVLVVQHGSPIILQVVTRIMPSPPALDVEVETEEGARQILTPPPAAVRPTATRVLDGESLQCCEITLSVELPLGYHTIRLADTTAAPCRLIIVPERCYLPPELTGDGMLWGLSAQLYSLKRSGDWGIGDFSDLIELVDTAATLGASIIGINPLHALFLTDPDRASPYSPATRLFLNPLYIDVEAVPEFRESGEAKAAMTTHAAEIARAWTAPHVDYATIAAVKLDVLKVLFDEFRKKSPGREAPPRRQLEFDEFRRREGKALHRFAIFQALSEQLVTTPWQEWPVPLRDPASPEVAQFVRNHRERVDFYEYLQWLADEQLSAAQAAAVEKGLPVGLYRDIAIGAARESGDGWSDQELLVQHAKVGCPPDPFNMLGQDWEIPPLHPFVLRERGYEPFAAILRNNMRHAGAVRIDHVMGLMHLFWMAADDAPANGAYVKYPFEDLLGVLALESQRHHCLVVGEDLGTVPEGFRAKMAARNILSYRVLYFEKDGDRLRRPDEYPAMALACVTTHDLATLVGFWSGDDIALKQKLALYPSLEALNGETEARVHDRYLMLQALQGAGLLPPGLDPNNVDGAPMDARLIAALHGYLAQSPAKILLVQVDDLMREREQINLPGTIDERPNWRRKLSQPVDRLTQAPTMLALKGFLAAREPRATARARVLP